MAPPIVEVNDSIVFVNSPILASDMFSAFDPDGPIAWYTFQDFHSSPTTGYFSLDGVPYSNGSNFTISAAQLSDLRYIGGPQVSREGFRVIARDQIGDSSSPQSIATVYTVRANTTTPHVLQPLFTVLANEYISGSEFISGYDPDGYPLTEFRISEANKVSQIKSAYGVITVSSHLHRYHSGDVVTLSGANESEFNLTGTISVISPHAFQIFGAGVADGLATGTMRSSTDNLGYFELNGVKQAQGETIVLSPDEIDDLRYYTSGPNAEENIYLQGFDGAEWSYDKKGLATTRVNASRPVGQFGRATTPADQLMPLEGTFEVTDTDGNTMKQYRFYNTSPYAFNGDLIFQGAVMPRTEWFDVSAEDLDEVFFQTSRVGFEQQIRFIAFDGRYWSDPSTLSISSTVPIVRPETVVNGINVVAEQLETVPVGPLFSKTDSGPAHTLFEIFEPSTLPSSGHFNLGATPMAGGQIHQISSQQFNQQLTFNTGDFYVRDLDTVYSRSSNGSDWGKWQKIEIRTEPEIDDVLTSGNDWNGILPINSAGKLQVTFSFMQQFPAYDTGEAIDGDPADLEHFEIFNQAQRANARLAFRHMETFANVQFVEVSDSSTNVLGGIGGIIRMGEYGIPAPDSTASAFAFLPAATDSAGDMWFNRLNFPNPFGTDLDFVPGTWGYKVFMHEFGHAMGLKHPHDGTPRLPPETDVNDFSVMSYSQPDNGEPTTYQLYDMRELQSLYGANMANATGDDVYSIAEHWGGRTLFVETIWDAGGNDTLSAVGSPRPSVVDLRSGQRSTIGFYPGNVNIAFDAEIENGTGSNFGDELFGNALDNVLLGRGGNDYLNGNAGNDYLTGGAGNDIFEWGVADGDDVINEQALAGRDMLRIASFPTVNVLEEDFKFTLDGRDLLIDLVIDGGSIDGTMRVVNQLWGGYRVESLELNGVRIDLANLTGQLAPGVDTFKIEAGSTPFGQLVSPA